MKITATAPKTPPTEPITSQFTVCVAKLDGDVRIDRSHPAFAELTLDGVAALESSVQTSNAVLLKIVHGHARHVGRQS